MEFPFDVAACIGAPPDEAPFLGCVDERRLQGSRSSQLCLALEALGKSSAVAQGLRKPVTYGTTCQSGHRIYLLADGNRALGFLKVGTKHLFVVAPTVGANDSSSVQDTFQEISPLCALDFYVHESCQRSGFGRVIFDAMLEQERVRPEQVAYDRPSPKLLAFLRKHFGLSRPNSSSAHQSRGLRSGSTQRREAVDAPDNGSTWASEQPGSWERASSRSVLPRQKLWEGQEPGGVLGCARLPPTPCCAVDTVNFAARHADAGSLGDFGAPSSARSRQHEGQRLLPPRQKSSASSTRVQAPWAAEAAGTGSSCRPPLGPFSLAGVAGLAPDQTPAGVPSRGSSQARSASVPPGRPGMPRRGDGAAGDAPWIQDMAFRNSADSRGGDRRFASPLPAAGQRVLHR